MILLPLNMKNYNEVCDVLADGHAFANDATGCRSYPRGTLSGGLEPSAWGAGNARSVATSQDKQCPASDTRREEKSREKAVS